MPPPYICCMSNYRQASREDIPALVELVNSAYRGESSKKGWTTEADLLDGIRTDEQALNDLISTKGSVMLVQEDENGQIVGCVNLQSKPGKLYLGMLTVSPLLQGGGIGKKLLYAADEFARQQNVPFIEMTVISVREELINWYKRHGYQETGEKKPFPSNDPRFGIPKQVLEFIVLEKKVSG